MGDFATLLLLLILLATAGVWLTFSRARDRAIQTARIHCQKHGLQLLDETVGLSGLRLRKLNGQHVLERRYSFEVSIDGDDRETGHLWMIAHRMTALILPTIELYTAQSSLRTVEPITPSTDTNVLTFLHRDKDRNNRH